MPVVVIPSLMRGLTGGRDRVEVEGATVGEVIEAIDHLYPGVRRRLLDGRKLKPGLAVAVDGELCRRGAEERVGNVSVVRLLPAVEGG